jgi:enamine deaminase RidA (YjgF/YER057c/UK114 family)
MPKIHNPPGVAAPAAAYSHVAEVKAGSRMLFLAGQVGIDPQGKLKQGAGAQAEQVYLNIKTLLEAEGMTLGNIVKVTTYLVDPDDMAAMRAARDKVFGDIKPPSTLVVISRLAAPEFKIEVEAVAAED